MPRLHHLIPVLVAAHAHAAELTLEMKPFFIAHDITATAMPAESSLLRLDAERWTDFEIVSIAPHASSVKKDAPLVVFDTVEIEKSLADTKRAISTGTLELAQAELDLATLGKTVPEQLARLKRGADEAAEELAYFTETGRKNAEESAGFDLKRREQILASYQEELKQLLQMYEADDLTEDTEEIILQKQRDSVEAAEFALRMEILDNKRVMELRIPRQGIGLTEKRDDTALQLDKASKDLPRSIELKKLEIVGLKTSLQRDREALAETEKDRALFEIKAPADGIFYHGSIEDGKWITGDLVKALVPEGKVPVHKNFATFIPSAAPLELQAFLDQATAQVLAIGAKGTASLPGRQDIAIPVSLKALASAPNPDHTYSATFTATWPENLKPVAGQTLKLHLVSYAVEKTLAVPTKALAYGPGGWNVEVKLADGKTEHRPVTRGRSSAEETEIPAGLEPGQVIITP